LILLLLREKVVLFLDQIKNIIPIIRRREGPVFIQVHT
jgi:hypothetical protein